MAELQNTKINGKLEVPAISLAKDNTDLTIESIYSDTPASTSNTGIKLSGSYCTSPGAPLQQGSCYWKYNFDGFCFYSPQSNSLLGSYYYPWKFIYCQTTYTKTLGSAPFGGDLQTTSNIVPSSNSTSTTTGRNLGSSSLKWRYLYAYGGTIQTSDRSMKSNINYIDKPLINLMSAEPTSATNITQSDVIDFVQSLNPATFIYKDGTDNPTQAEAAPEMIQLGLIADDIKEHPVFKYIGVESEAFDVDEEGNKIDGTEHTTLGLQPIPLATAALTSCKYLLQKNENLENTISDLKKKIESLEYDVGYLKTIV